MAMLRGAVDFSDGWRVGGWLYSPEVAVRDRLVLAFVDGDCVGSGTIDRFRQDLADVGLGDGHCGFDFPVRLVRAGDRERVCIKLDLSDFALLQKGARIVGGAARAIERTAASADSIGWMRKRGWIGQAEAAFLADLATCGVHELAVRDPVVDAKRLFALYRQTPVRVQEALIRLDNLAAERSRLVEGAAIPIVALHAPAGEVVVSPSGEAPGPARYSCGDDRLLFVDMRADVVGVSGQTARVYRAV